MIYRLLLKSSLVYSLNEDMKSSIGGKNMFKKISLSFFTLFLLLTANPSTKISAQDIHDLKTIEKVVEKIQTIEKIENLNVTGYEVLYDIECNPTYLFIKLDDGYAISSRKNGIISEYDIMNDSTNYENLFCSYKLYGGPFNYGCHNQVSTMSMNEDNFSAIAEKNKNFLSIEDNTFIPLNLDVSVQTTASWSNTIPSSRMSRYASGKWINSNSNYPTSSGYPSGGICGTIASAGLLAYYDDYINDDYVPSSIRARNSSTPGTLITTLFNYIDKGKNGTKPSDLGTGINQWLQKYGYATYGHRAGFSLLTFSTAKSKINQGRPVCVGLLSILGSPSNYGDHWTLAYQYIDDSGTTSDMYRIVDNHGSYTKTIYVSWTSGIVSFED